MEQKKKEAAKKSVYRVTIRNTLESCVFVKAESPEAAERLAEAKGAADLSVVDERKEWGDVEYECDGEEWNDQEPDIDADDEEALVEGIIASMVQIPGKDYLMGKFPVTQAQWEAVTGENPSEFKGAENPVEKVSWWDCDHFLNALNAQPAAKASGLTFRLPSQEEWEFACRADGKENKLEAGTTFVTDDGWCRLADGTEITKETVGEVAWIEDNSGGKTHPVGQKKPNAFGLYDMFGNVVEWTNTADGGKRSIRGGSYYHPADVCVGCYKAPPHSSAPSLGFRLCADRRAD